MSLTFKVNDDDDYPFLEFNINNQVKFKYCDLGDLEDWQTMKNSIQEGKDNSFGAGGNSCSGFEYSSDKESFNIDKDIAEVLRAVNLDAPLEKIIDKFSG